MSLDRSPSSSARALGALVGLVVLAACTDKAATPVTGTNGKTTAASAVAYVDTAVEFEDQVFIPAWHSRLNWPSDSTLVLDSLMRTGSQGSTVRGQTLDTLFYGPVYYSIYKFLRNAGDQHSDFFSPTIAPGSSGAVNTDPTGTLAGFMLGANAGVRTGSPVAYLWYPAYDGNTDQLHVDSTQNLIRNLDQNSPCGYVLDLRLNNGGSVFPMVAGLTPLIGNAVVSGASQGVAGWGVDFEGATNLVYISNGAVGQSSTANTPPVVAARDTFFSIQAAAPYTLRRPNSPVAILIDTATASAAEFITLSFAGGPVPYRTFGGNTYGVTTTPYGYQFNDGAFLNIAGAIMRDRTGAFYGSSIAPDTPIPNANTYSAIAPLVPAVAQNNPDATVQAAVSWLNSQPSCGGSATAVAPHAAIRSTYIGGVPMTLRPQSTAVVRPKARVSPVWMVSRPRMRKAIIALQRQH